MMLRAGRALRGVAGEDEALFSLLGGQRVLDIVVAEVIVALFTATLAGAAHAVGAIHGQIDLLAIGGVQYLLARVAVDETGDAVLEVKSNTITHSVLSGRPASDVIDVDDLVDIIVLQDHFLAQDDGFRAGGIERVERGAEKAVGHLVAMAQRVPVEAQVQFAVALLSYLPAFM